MLQCLSAERLVTVARTRSSTLFDFIVCVSTTRLRRNVFNTTWFRTIRRKSSLVVSKPLWDLAKFLSLNLGGFLACPNVLSEASLPSLCQSWLPMARFHGQWPWLWAMASDHWLWPWPEPMAIGHGQWQWPSAIASGHGHGHGSWPWQS